MRVYAWIAVLCFNLSWSVWPVLATTGVGLEQVMAKLDQLQQKLLEIELRIKSNTEAIANSLTRLESIQNSFTIVQADTQNILAQSKLHQETLQTNAKKLIEMQKTRNNGPFASCLTEPTKFSGKYFIQLEGTNEPLEVYCEQSTLGGGWVVIQHRFNGSVDFNRNWTDYRDGFGNIDGEYWLGLERIHQMTSQRPHELLVEVKDFGGTEGYAHYSAFEIRGSAQKYAVKKLGDYIGTIGDSMRYSHGEKFSTADNDNDQWSDGNCAAHLKGPWWYYTCSGSNLNGLYQNKESEDSMSWFDFRSLAYSRMMIRVIKS